jgi:hypothetical protein
MNPADDPRARHDKVFRAYHTLMTDLVAIVGPELKRIAANARQDEPQSPEDAAVLKVIEKVLDAMNKAGGSVPGTTDGNN